MIDHPQVRYVHLGKNRGMRGAINAGVAVSRGQFIMKTDEHCSFSEGFDKAMVENCAANHVMTALRHALDVDKWEVMEGPPTGYEKLVFHDNCRFAGVRWRNRDIQRKDYEIDETMAFQGSCYVMSREWWDKVVGPLQIEGYGPFIQEMTEIGFKTWKAGGKLMLNKKAWYAHKHRKFKRTWSTNMAVTSAGRAYARDKWLDYFEKEIRPRWR